MPNKAEEKLSDRMDALLLKLDKAPLAPTSIFKTEAQKEHYESLLMFAFRKRQGAQYHRKRIDVIAAVEQAEADKILKAPEGSIELKPSSIKMSISKSNNDYAHELSAFCAAIRTSMDFLARLLAEHTKAVQVFSISSYLSWAEEGRTGPTVAVIAKHAKWLRHIQSYRDYLIHRLVLNTMSGQERVYRHGTWANNAYPVTVPSETLKHVPDTRRSRMMDEPEQRFNYSTTKAWLTDEKGESTIFQHSIEISPREGDIRIEEMMDRELKAFDSFFNDLVEVLLVLDFAPAAIALPKAGASHLVKST
ncbi:MAG: hypothetical protein LCH93_21005 [Proteobacteria bacterium]|nr:hypothetical protein [Pseudomonadota bacterium]